MSDNLCKFTPKSADSLINSASVTTTKQKALPSLVGPGAEFLQRYEYDNVQRQCWVCFETNEDDRSAAWVRPCRCRGTSKWVHERCLLRWIDEKQRGDTFAKVNCSLCKFEYALIYPPFGRGGELLLRLERLISRANPFLTFAVVCGTWYLLARRHVRYYHEPSGVTLYGDLAADNAISVFARISLCLNSANVGLQTLSTLTLPLIAAWLYMDRTTSEPPLARYLLGGACLALLGARGFNYAASYYKKTWRQRKRLVVEYSDDSSQYAAAPSTGE